MGWKRLLSLAAAVCTGVCMMPSLVRAEGSKANETYLALGDSISAGYGVNENQRFTNLLAKDMGLDLINMAADGETSQTLLDKLDDPKVVSAIKDADLITITIGGNDMMNVLYNYLTLEWNAANPQPITVEAMKEKLEKGDLTVLRFASSHASGLISSPQTAVAFATFSGNVMRIANAIRTANPQARLFWATQYNPYTWLPAQCNIPALAQSLSKIEAVFDTVVVKLNQTLLSVSAANPEAYATFDVYNAFVNSADNLCNATYTVTSIGFPAINLDFHPNAAGHAVIASVMGKALAQAWMTEAEAAIAESFAGLMLDQSQADSKEAVIAYLNQAIAAHLASGMTAVVSVLDDDFTPAATDDGKFKAVVRLTLNGMTQDVEISGVIKAPEPEIELPKTGDTHHVLLYLLLMAASGTIAVIAMRRKAAYR